MQFLKKALTVVCLAAIFVLIASRLMALVNAARAGSLTAVQGGVNGGLIALTLRDQNGKLQIFTIAPDGTNRKQLTFDGDNGRPDWSPDGRRITFNAKRNGNDLVAVMDADGSNQKLLTVGAAPDWSPDGKQIAYTRPDSQVPQIWVINADGSNIRQITQSNTAKIAPSWSPDGQQMVFVWPKNLNSPSDPQPEIGIINSDGTNERILTTADRINVRVNPDGSTTVCETANDANAPAWSPVDNRITFWSGIENQYGQIWVINSDGTGSKQLTEDCSHRNSDDPSWSPDGKKILFSTGRSGRNELWVMDADGSNEKKVSDIDAVPFPGRASWQPVVTAPRTVANVSAASYLSTSLAPESIVSAFGSGLATSTLAASSSPLPTTLAGATVKVRDSAGTEHLAPLFFVSPAQVNYQMPAGTAPGGATIIITSGDGSVSVGNSQIATIAPGLFTVNASGQGVAAAVVFRVKADGSQSYEPVAQFDTAQNKFVAIPIDLGPETDQVFLILFATGLRYRSALSAVSAKLGATDAQVMFAGAQGGFVGLDQVNVRLPRSMIGRGEVDFVLTLDGQTANTVKVAFAGQSRSDAFQCTHFSQTNQWFIAGFENQAIAALSVFDELKAAIRKRK